MSGLFSLSNALAGSSASLRSHSSAASRPASSGGPGCSTVAALLGAPQQAYRSGGSNPAVERAGRQGFPSGFGPRRMTTELAAMPRELPHVLPIATSARILYALSGLGKKPAGTESRRGTVTWIRQSDSDVGAAEPLLSKEDVSKEISTEQRDNAANAALEAGTAADADDGDADDDDGSPGGRLSHTSAVVSKCSQLLLTVQMVYDKSRVQKLLPVLILIGYTFLGAAIFQKIERPPAEIQIAATLDYVHEESQELYQQVEQLRLEYLFNVSVGANYDARMEFLEMAKEKLRTEVYHYALVQYHSLDKELLLSRIHPHEDVNLAHILNETFPNAGYFSVEHIRNEVQRTMARISIMEFYIDQLRERLAEIVIEEHDRGPDRRYDRTFWPKLLAGSGYDTRIDAGYDQYIRSIHQVQVDWNITRNNADQALQRFTDILGLRHYNHWTFKNALFLAITTYTTIGYGNVVPRTQSGRIAVMIYAVIGIPLMLVILQKMGRAFLVLLQKAWGMLESIYLFCRCTAGSHVKMVTDDFANENNVPLSLAIGITLAWMFLSAEVFSYTERDWDYFKSFYFVFISFATVGFGDVVPTSDDALYVFLLMFVGLSLVSMTINVIQLKLEMLFEAMWQELMKEYSQAQYVDGEMEPPPPGKLSMWELMKIVREKKKKRRRSALSVSSSKDKDKEHQQQSMMFHEHDPKVHHSVSRKTGKELMEEWRRLYNMKAKGTQTDFDCDTEHRGTQTDGVMAVGIRTEDGGTAIMTSVGTETAALNNNDIGADLYILDASNKIEWDGERLRRESLASLCESLHSFAPVMEQHQHLAQSQVNYDHVPAAYANKYHPTVNTQQRVQQLVEPAADMMSSIPSSVSFDVADAEDVHGIHEAASSNEVEVFLAQQRRLLDEARAKNKGRGARRSIAEQMRERQSFEADKPIELGAEGGYGGGGGGMMRTGSAGAGLNYSAENRNLYPITTSAKYRVNIEDPHRNSIAYDMHDYNDEAMNAASASTIPSTSYGMSPVRSEPPISAYWRQRQQKAPPRGTDLQPINDASQATLATDEFGSQSLDQSGSSVFEPPSSDAAGGGGGNKWTFVRHRQAQLGLRGNPPRGVSAGRQARDNTEPRYYPDDMRNLLREIQLRLNDCRTIVVQRPYEQQQELCETPPLSNPAGYRKRLSTARNSLASSGRMASFAHAPSIDEVDECEELT